MVVGGGGVTVSVRLTTAAAVAVDGVAVAAVTLLSRDAPADGGIKYLRTLAALDSIARGSSSVNASAVEIGDCRAASGVVVVGGGEFAVSVRSTTVTRVLAAVVALLSSRVAPLQGGMTKSRTQAALAVDDAAAAGAAVTVAAVAGGTTGLEETGDGAGRGVPDDGGGVGERAGASFSATAIACRSCGRAKQLPRELRRRGQKGYPLLQVTAADFCCTRHPRNPQQVSCLLRVCR